MNKLENMISNIYNKKYSYFTGNGTTALYLIFKALNKKDKKVVFPNITCMAPVNSAIYAGYEVVFCDVNLDDYTMNLESLKRIVDKEDIGIVVPTHIYGHICDMKSIYNYCKEKNIIVIEDGAQTTEISDDNDFAVTSFGHTKILETAIGGGVIFYKDNNYKDSFEHNSKDLNYESNNEDFKLYTRKYYEITKSLSGARYHSSMKELQICSKDIFLRHFKYNEELINVITKKDSIVLDRKKRTEIYIRNLYKNEFIYSQQINVGNYPLWRLSLLVRDIDRNKFVDEVRKNNIDISTWYPCLHKFYSKQKDDELVNSINVSENIVNFWVTEKYSELKIERDINKINDILKHNSLGRQ